MSTACGPALWSAPHWRYAGTVYALPHAPFPSAGRRNTARHPARRCPGCKTKLPSRRVAGLVSQILHQQTDRAPGSAFFGAGLPGYAGNVQMRPSQFAREAVQETGGGDGAGLAPADVGEIGEVAVQV